MNTSKFILCMMCMPLLMACSKDNHDENVTVQTPAAPTMPSTEIFVQGGVVDAVSLENLSASNSINGTRAGIEGRDYNKWPYVNKEEGWETARFSIRADGKIVGVSDQSSSLYFGRSAGKMGKNRGAVHTMYPYGRYNDRDLDYYQKDKKTGENIGLFRYVYDETGMKTQAAIEDAPLVIDILDDEKTDLEAAIAKGQNVAKNQASLDKVNALMAKGSDYLEKHVLWYVVKEVGMRYGWHINGVIADHEVEKYVVDPTKADDNVEIDIHQQKHNDWCEIKTSVHVRSDIESIKINLPIREDNILEQDDFAIRVYDFYYKEYVIKHTVTHNADGITIEISDIPASLIEELKAKYGDGLTVEIHSYCKREDEVWDDLKNSTVISMGKECELKGQITSALKDGVVVPIKMKE